MASILFNFHTYLVDGQDNIIRQLSDFRLGCPVGHANPSIPTSETVITNNYTYFTSRYGGELIFGSGLYYKQFNAGIETLNLYVPLIVPKQELVSSDNPYYLKFINDSGYYAKSTTTVQNLPNNGFLPCYMYNDSGTRIGTGTMYMGTQFNRTDFAFDLIVSIELADDVITSMQEILVYSKASDAKTYTYRLTRSNYSEILIFFNGLTQYKEQTDPYSGAGASGPGGGDGTFDFSSTPIDYPGLPTIGAYSTGFLNVYVPSAANLRSLAAYMWAGSFDIDNFRKLVADPMDAIMGLSIVPVTSAEIGVESTTLIVGNISTGISMPRALSQYVAVDCGTIEMPAKWGAYLDFSPYTKLQLYLPYIGFVDISPDDVMTANEGNEDDKMYPGTIGVQYHIDILSGTCVAFVKCRDHVIYEFGGNCSCGCPVTSGQYKNGAFGVLEILSSLFKMEAASMDAPSKFFPKSKSGKQAMYSAGAAEAQGVMDIADSTISMIKPSVARSGMIGGSNGLMGYQIPYLVLTVPHMCIPGDQNVYIGYPSFVTLEMSELAGFTQIQITHLHNMSCTSDEADEIISLLSEGVIF